MQIKFFTIPIVGGEVITEDMNVFLRAKTVLSADYQLINDAKSGAFWCFCIKYIEDGKEQKKTDYRQTLDEKSFQRFSKLREIRKQIATQEAIPAYAVFTDEELAELAKLQTITASTMRNIKGIGERKIEKFGPLFFTTPPDEKGN